ncbi:hypothetical protein ABIF63_006310 [Bradyrhizobium japonicum]|uniref:DUF3551 domain-containing protein n=1 Tax=Bradyrhizobium japonicum TaxID=375 RepID=A0ABV2RZ44_BRAJP
MRSIRNAILLVAGLPGMALLTTAPARSQTYDPRYPVCIEIYTIDGSSIDCSFTSIAQCCDRFRAVRPVLRQPLCTAEPASGPGSIAAATEPLGYRDPLSGLG